jgi:hypothetical protein
MLWPPKNLLGGLAVAGLAVICNAFSSGGVSSVASAAVVGWGQQETVEKNDDAVVIRSPREYQVIQRYSIDEGALVISGRVNVPCDSVRAQVVGKSRSGEELPNDWQKLSYHPLTQSFHYATHFPAGGWYELKIQAMLADEVVGEQTVQRFGIGEVFIGAGQSNSTNSGEFKIEQSSGMVSSFGGEHWQLANDPQIGVHDRSQGGSYYPAFGDELYAELKVPIGIAATGFGGTSVNQWQPNEALHQWMMTRIHQLGPQGFRAVLWHQGESDVGMNPDEYYQKLKTIIESSKEKAGWEFPWFVAQVSYHNPENPSFDTTRTAQAKLWADGVALEGPDTDVLGGENRDVGGKGIHFSPIGLKAHGEMWAEKVKVLFATSDGQSK